MKLRRQFAVLLTASVAAGASTLIAIGWSVNEARRLAEQEEQAASIARQLSGMLVLTQDYLLHAEPRAQQQWQARYRLLAEAVSGGVARTDSALPAPPQRLIDQVEVLPELFAELKALPPAGQDTPFLARRRELLVDRLLANIQALSEHAYQQEQDITRWRAEGEARLMAFAIAAPTALALLLGAVGWVLLRRVLRPLAELRHSMAAVARGGDLSVRHASTASDEIGELSRQFDDMTARLQEQTSALRASETMLRLVTDNLPAMIGYWDSECRNRFANADYRRWFGKSPEEIHGKHIEALLGPELYAKNKPYIEAALAGQRQDFDRTIPGADGVVRHSQASYIPDIHDGRVQGFFVLVTDVTDRVHSEQALAQAVRDRETLLKEVYHRVKNNLQVVQSLLKLQVRAVRDPTAQSALREMAERVRAMALVHQQLYRGASLSDVALRPYVEDLVHQLVLGSGRSPADIAVRIDVAPRAIGIDTAIPLGLLLTELITNSLKHAFVAQRQPELSVAIGDAPGGDGVMIRASDNGCGLPASFDPHTARSMGMQLAAALARQLGGELHFESAGGTSAWLVVPNL